MCFSTRIHSINRKCFGRSVETFKHVSFIQNQIQNYQHISYNYFTLKLIRNARDTSTEINTNRHGANTFGPETIWVKHTSERCTSHTGQRVSMWLKLGIMLKWKITRRRPKRTLFNTRTAIKKSLLTAYYIFFMLRQIELRSHFVAS